MLVSITMDVFLLSQLDVSFKRKNTNSVKNFTSMAGPNHP